MSWTQYPTVFGRGWRNTRRPLSRSASSSLHNPNNTNRALGPLPGDNSIFPLSSSGGTGQSAPEERDEQAEGREQVQDTTGLQPSVGLQADTCIAASAEVWGERTPSRAQSAGSWDCGSNGTPRLEQLIGRQMPSREQSTESLSASIVFEGASGPGPSALRGFNGTPRLEQLTGRQTPSREQSTESRSASIVFEGASGPGPSALLGFGRGQPKRDTLPLVGTIAGGMGGVGRGIRQKIQQNEPQRKSAAGGRSPLRSYDGPTTAFAFCPRMETDHVMPTLIRGNAVQRARETVALFMREYKPMFEPRVTNTAPENISFCPCVLCIWLQYIEERTHTEISIKEWCCTRCDHSSMGFWMVRFSYELWAKVRRCYCMNCYRGPQFNVKDWELEKIQRNL